MPDLDLDAIELRAVLGNRGPTGIEGAALVAEVRRLRAIEDAARELLEAEGLPMFPKSVRSRRLIAALEDDG